MQTPPMPWTRWASWLDLAPYFTDEERAAYVDSYLTEGDFDDSGSIKIFPVAKSTELLFLNDTDWKLFAAATGARVFRP